MRKRQAGLTLVELMVALVIGLLIVLGATQLFIIGKRSFDQVQVLGIKQGVMNFATDTLIEDIRKAKLGGVEAKDNDRALSVEFSDYGNEAYCGSGKKLLAKHYRLRESPKDSGDYALSVKVECEGGGAGVYQPLASGFVENSLYFKKLSLGLWQVSFEVNGQSTDEENKSKKIEFVAMNRAEVVEAINGND